MRRIVLALVVLVALPAAASAGPLGIGSCAPAQGFQQCSGLVPTWDGVPLDTTVTFPAGDARPLPLVVELNGFGNSRFEYLDPASSAYTGNAWDWARRGYLVLTYTARGLWGSCGTPESRLASPDACAAGYLHLADTRYEVRDAQELIGRLVDEGLADPARIGVTGDSYGGGQTLTLAALRDRVMEPDGRLVPWRSPRGTPLRLAAAAPVIPWSDLPYAIAPNGRTRAVGVTPARDDYTPVGVFKTSIANAIFAAAEHAIGPGQPVGEPFIPGRPMGYLAPPGSDPGADVSGWVARSDLGEPYDDPTAVNVVEQAERYHSAYSIPSSSPPPPLLISSGFTDDIFPVDEALRFANRMRRQYPKVPAALLFGDFGHQRAANKAADRALLLRTIEAWFDWYLRGVGPRPADGVTALTQTCPRERASEGPFHAPSVARIARGAVKFVAPGAQTIASTGGDPSVGAAIDPAAGGGDGCAVTSAADASGTAVYRLPKSTGFTLLGAPHIAARLSVSGAPPANTQVAARLWDVAPDGSGQRLVARGLYRPSGEPHDDWELHANGWRFEPGHIPKLELLGADPPYGRPSNATFSVRVETMTLTLPTREGPCSSRRRITIHLPRRLRSAHVSVNQGRIRIHRSHGRLVATIDLRGTPRGTVTVRISGRTKVGRRIAFTRKFRTCKPKPTVVD